MKVGLVVAAVMLAAAAVETMVGAAPLGSPPTDAWAWPTAPHALVRGYEAPATPYSAGHRGIDLVARPGQYVLAPANGVVSFAGVVVDRPLVTVQLADGVLVSVEPVQPSVRTGEQVQAGTSLGVVAAGGHCEAQCLHLGARVHGAYVSPLLFLGGIPRAVLLPMHGSVPAPAQARGWASR